MGQFKFALLALLTSERLLHVHAFQSGTHKVPPRRTLALESRRGVASSLSQQQPFEDGNAAGADLQAAVSNITASYLESMSMELSMETDVENEAIEQRLDQRASSRQPSNQFRVQFDLSSPFGLSLTQVRPGRKISNADLDLDMVNNNKQASVDDNREAGTQRMDWPTVAGRLESNFKGLLVSSVVQGGAAWEAGVRAGDVVSAVSATLGGSLWPTSTMEGIQSAIRSRKLTSGNLSMEFRRIAEEQIGNRYQLTLQRPLGIEVQENENGSVVVTGFSDSAPNLVRHAVQMGDRVVAVDSSFGDSMWPVTTVDGLTSAITSRLPGAPVTLQLERSLENMQTTIEYSEDQELVKPAKASAVVAIEGASSATSADVVDVIAEQSADKGALLKRCRDVLERYSVQSDTGKTSSSFKDKYEVPAIVADKVVDALASANVALDSVTLSMIMRAYLSCKRPDSALRVFEGAVRFRADASCFSPVDSLIGGSGGAFVPNESALNLYTGTALLQAHAMKGDLYSVSRVLASLEGRSGVLVGGLESAPWPFTGAFGAIQPDTTCYNIAISAAAKIGGQEGLEMALALFDTMANSEQDSQADRKPQKDVVSYNTIISALASAGRPVEAFRVFDQMRRFRLRPDKFTYTPLIKACLNDGDIEELLYDMKENNIKGDTVTYNTIIRSLCRKRRWTDASKLVTEMESRGVSPNSRTYGTLMSAMLRADKPNACLSLFESACSSSRTSALTENVYLYTTAITAASVLGDYERAIELLSRMTSKGVKPNLKTLTSVTGACLVAGKPDLASQLYLKIENADGYAMCQGIEALSRSGEHHEALELMKTQHDRKSRVMTGKQIMKSYRTMLVSSLKFREFESAQLVFSDLLKRGYIPSRAMMHDVCEALGFNDVRGMVSFAIEENEAIPVFRFMMFVLDSLLERRLPVDSYIYSVILFLGRTHGGKPRAIASLVARSKVSANEERLIVAEAGESEIITRSWADLVDHFDEYDASALERLVMPAIPVQVAHRI